MIPTDNHPNHFYMGPVGSEDLAEFINAKNLGILLKHDSMAISD